MAAFGRLSLCLAIALFAHEFARSQGCCTTGTISMSGLERGAITEGTLSASLGYQNSHLDKTYQGTARVGDPLARTGDVQVFKLEVEYGLVSKVSLLLNVSYVSRLRELTGRDAQTGSLERIAFEGSGWGDPILLIKYQALTPTFSNPLGITLGGGTKLPAGNYRLTRGGTRLPIDLQPGNGAIDILSWFLVEYNLQEPSVGMHVNGMYRYSSTNFDGYRFGDEVTTAFGLAYPVVDYLRAGLSLRGRFARPDYSNRRTLDGTGGTSWLVEAQVLYFQNNATFRAFGQLPVYQNVRGNQLTTSHVFGLELLFAFDLGGGL
jgi:hypothetical protein